MKIKIIFIFLLLLNLIWYLIYALIDYNTLINNPTLDDLFIIYSSAIPSLISVLIAFISTIYALIVLRRVHIDEPCNRKLIIRNLIFILFSFGMLMFSCIVFWGIAKYMLFYR